MEASGCKSCKEPIRARGAGLPAEITEALNRLTGSKKVRLTDEKTYEERLSKCYSCEYLDLGTTCMQCGCIVQIRARLLKSTCPFPKNNMWNSIRSSK